MSLMRIVLSQVVLRMFGPLETNSGLQIKNYRSNSSLDSATEAN